MRVLNVQIVFAFLTFLWSFIATPVSISLARTFRLMDAPGGRKTHAAVTPRGAGIVLWTGYILWCLLNPSVEVEPPYIATGATAVFLIGYMDDMRPLRASTKFICHLLAAAFMTWKLPCPLTQRLVFIVWTTGVTSAYNLIDGMDGLCLSLTLCTAAVFSVMGADPAQWFCFATLVLGVLLWNFPVARTFLGDGGSTLLGYLCASQIVWDQFPYFFDLSLPRLLFVLAFLGGIPVMDTFFAMARRVVRKKSPFEPDRGHAHHRLQDRGLSKGQVLLVLVPLHLLALCAGLYFAGAFTPGG